MEQNGSPPPRFDFDEARSYFRVTLPVHPEYQAILALQDVAQLRAVGDSQGAMQRLREAYLANPATLGIAVELARELVAKGDIHAVEDIHQQFVSSNPVANPTPLITLIASAWLDAGKQHEAIAWLDRLPLLDVVSDAFEAAIQEKRAGRLKKAHRYFQLAGTAVLQDAKALHEFAQVKMKLAGEARPRNQSQSNAANLRLLNEAKEMLLRVVQMDTHRTRYAWAWYDLGRVLRWSKASLSEIRHAFEKAVECDPNEERFSRALTELGERNGKS